MRYLAFRKVPKSLGHRDERLFAIVHQASELWLNLATSKVSDADQ
jgi:tryptophan 2,3-dioxygenase